MADFNILQLYQQVFSISATSFNVPAVVSNAAKTAEAALEFAAGEAFYSAYNSIPGYQDVSNSLDPASYPKSVLGTPIYEQITLKIPATFDGTKQVSFPYSYTFPDWPIFDITPAWYIKKENVQNANGTIKEFIQQDDYAITIRGFLINYGSDDYPEQLVKEFWTAINCQQAMEIESRVFGIFGIKNVVVESANLVGVEGYMNIQPFELQCISDMPIELLI